MHKRWYLALIVAMALAGCQKPAMRHIDPPHPAGYLSDPGLSYANNVMHAAGLTRIVDMPAPDQSQEIPVASRAGAAINTGIAAYTNYYGIGGLGSGLVHGLLKMGDPKKVVHERNNRIIGWMPREAVPADVTPEQHWQSTLDGMALSLVRLRHPGDAVWHFETVFNSQGDHYKGTCFSAEHVGQECKAANFLTLKTPNAEFMPITSEPDFIGDGEAYLARGSVFYYRLHVVDSEYVGQGIYPLDFYVQLSRLSPDWVFVYLAPEKYTFEDESGVAAMGKVPVVLNRGQIHRFAKPIATTPVASR